ncbi:hypothetical protein C8A00DRAFT_19451, partial [Chaetomidium leptoderma]
MSQPRATLAAGVARPAGPVPTHPLEDANAEARQFAQKVSEEAIWLTSQRFLEPHFPYPTEKPLVWVKFGEEERQAEADMQSLAWQWVRSERQAKRCSPGIHIPEVFKTFSRNETTFIIMELLDATVLSKSVFARPTGSLHPVEQCYDLIAEGIQVLRRIPVPADATPGPYTPDRRLRIIRHPLFKEQRASMVYQNVDELEQHINKLIPIVFRRGGAPTVELERELVFTYSDFNDENFMFNTDSDGRLRLYIIDFEHASF